MTGAKGFDVSVVVNTHAGSAYLTRALRSIEAAAQVAREAGLRLELLFVMNQSPPAHLALARSYASSRYDDIRLIEVSHESLGLAREDGLQAARGEYVMFADDDDLISNNSIVAFHYLAEQLGRYAIIIPQYLLVCGARIDIAEYRGLDHVSPLSMIKYHPFISRIFIHASARQYLHYADVSINSGYAYEDWHFNAEAIANGYTFACAPETILFYRQRMSGLLSQFRTTTTRQIPPSALFAPETYLRVCESAVAAFDGGFPEVDLEAVRRRFLDDPACLFAVHAANQIDPMINWHRIEDGSAWINWAGDQRPGAAYYRACERIRGRTFDHVVLCDNLSDEPTARRLKMVLGALRDLHPDAGTLLLVGSLREGFAAHGLGDDARNVQIDLGALGAGLPAEDLDSIGLRLIESTAPKACLHLFGGAFARRFFNIYGKILGDMRVIYYREIDRVRFESKLPFIDGADFEFVSDHVTSLNLIVSDCRYAMARDQSRIGFLQDRWRCFYSAPADATGAEQPIPDTRMDAIRLAWVAGESDALGASLASLAVDRLSMRGITAGIDLIEGSADGHPLRYRRLSSHADLRPPPAALPRPDLSAYDAVIHMAPSENLPTIVIDALAAGVPVVALASGGIGEVVINDATGWLIEPAISEDLAADVAETIAQCRRTSLVHARFASAARRHVGQLCDQDSPKALFTGAFVRNAQAEDDAVG